MSTSRFVGVAVARRGAQPVPMRPSDFPDRPFTSAQAEDAGISRAVLHEAVHRAVVRRIVRGVYVPADWPDDPQHRAAAAALVLREDQVLVDRTAAWVHGVDAFSQAELAAGPRIETAVPTQKRSSRLAGVRGRSRDLEPQDIEIISGIRVTTPLRTALDLACNLRRGEAIGCLDAFARMYGVRQGDLLLELPRFRGRRGVVQARALVPYVDARAESVRESQLRLAVVDAGLPCPTPQLEVMVEGVASRLDLGYEAHRLGIEYDGAEFHSSPEQREHDERRRDRLRRAGWRVVVVRSGDLSGVELGRWLNTVRQHLGLSYSTLRW